MSKRAFEYRAASLGMIVFSQFICSGFAQCGVLLCLVVEQNKRSLFHDVTCEFMVG